jgi:hypothetical protein
MPRMAAVLAAQLIFYLVVTLLLQVLGLVLTVVPNASLPAVLGEQSDNAISVILGLAAVLAGWLALLAAVLRGAITRALLA